MAFVYHTVLNLIYHNQHNLKSQKMSIQFLGTQASNNIKNICFSQIKYKSICSHRINIKDKTLWKMISRRMLHDNSSENSNHFKPFLDIVQCRRDQAKRSILVQVQSAKSYKELHDYCSRFGPIKEILHYKAGKEPMHFLVVEFQKQASVLKVLNSCHHIQDAHIVPVESTFLWFKASHKVSKARQSKSQIPLMTENGSHVLSDQDLRNKLQFCDNISDQILTLYNSTKLNDLGTRLRFLTARQIEVAISGIFPNAVAFPFGSSVNGFGKVNCDLDVVLRLSKDKFPDESRLVYHCKAAAGSERSISQRHMETIGDMIHLFLPGCSQVRKILQARVPIIKYYQQLTDVECDLSMSNMSGVYMSDLLHIWGSMDDRVRPLVFVIKKWAQEIGLTNNFPGRWITNFSLTLLVLSFLQKLPSPILPPLNTLAKAAGPNDKYVTEDGIDCSFVRDITKLKFKTENKDSLELLLLQFFEYYSTFDFSLKAICLNQAVSITKPEHCALYIVNPLERGLNVSKNVSFEEVERFRLEIRNAAWTLESQEKKNDNWGLLSLFENKSRQFPSMLPSIVKYTNRLMDVTKIFEMDKDNKNEQDIKVSKTNVDSISKENESDDIEGMVEVKTVKTKEKKSNVDNLENSETEVINVHAKRKTGS